MFSVSRAAEDLVLAEALRWGVSRLASRLRAEQPGSVRSLTRLAASVLANLRHGGELTPSELAAIEGLQTQSLTRVLNELEEQGRVRRVRSEVDARRHHVVITEAGRQALRDHVRDGNVWLAAALRQTLSPAERGVLQIAAGLLDQVAAAEATGAEHEDQTGPPSARTGRRRPCERSANRQGVPATWPHCSRACDACPAPAGAGRTERRQPAGHGHVRARAARHGALVGHRRFWRADVADRIPGRDHRRTAPVGTAE